MANGVWLRPKNPHYITVADAVSSGEIRQGADGRAYWRKSSQGASAGQADVQFEDGDLVTVVKTANIVLLDGGRVYWDRSAGSATFKKVDDQDFYLGTSVGDATSASTSCTVKWNEQQERTVCIQRDAFITAIVGTQALGGLALNRRGGTHNFLISATNEAQKLDALSKEGFATAANAIIEFAFSVPSDGAGTVVDVNVGIANATHASNADSITRYLFMHLDANNTAIRFQSTDGTTTVASTDSTKTYTEGQTAAVRKEVWMDMRNPADVQIYVDGVNVLPASVFDVSASAATWLLLAHIEKTASTDAYEFDLEWLYARTAEQ